ncbi:MAG: histidine kinase N-terminal 7TM domain-containing protein [Candidatus Hodarchaeales archaeon]|jgi:signal transduction histidine kinase
MPYEFTPFGVVMGTVTVLAFGIAIYPLIFRPRSRLIFHFVSLIGSSVIWCLGYTLEIFATDQTTKLFWVRIEYIGIMLISPLFLFFVLVFTQRTKTATKPIMGLLFFPPFLHWLLLATNEFHNQFYLSVSLNTETPFRTLILEYGLVFYSHTIYSYLLLIFAFFLLIRTYLDIRKTASEENTLFQKQILIVIIGTIFPIIGNIIRILKIPPFTFVDFTSIAFVICYILYFYALFEIGFLDIVPFAHQFIIRNLADIGIIATTKDNLIVDINKPACQYIFEGDCPNIIGANLFSILYSLNRLKPYQDGIRQIEKSLHEISGEIIDFEMEFLDTPEPRRQFFRITLQALRDKGDIYGFIYIVHNVSLEKEMEILLRKSIDFKTSLLSVISHDLKNQLMVIQGFTDVLRKEITQALIQNFDEMEEYLDGIDAKARQMQEIITDVRSYLKTMGTFEEAQLTFVNLKEIITEVISSSEPTIKEKNIKINLNLPSEPKIYTFADLRLRSVFNNLIDNAVKWSPPNDVIDIIVSEENQFWICSISDHGPGVPDGIKEEIFKPFVSIGPEGKMGSGLGLSISQEILQSYKSEIWIEDVKPQGAKFAFKLPVVKEMDF